MTKTFLLLGVNIYTPIKPKSNVIPGKMTDRLSPNQIKTKYNHKFNLI